MTIDRASLPVSLRRFAHMIADYSDEREYGEGVWVYLSAGFFCDHMDCRTIHEDSLRECAAILAGCRPATESDPV